MLSNIYPHLNNSDIEIILKGLKDYFKLYNYSSRRIIIVPSRLIHRAWNEFMSLSEDYDIFCKNAFGHYIAFAPIGYLQNNIANSDLKK
jgi:hypothetical protein